MSEANKNITVKIECKEILTTTSVLTASIYHDLIFHIEKSHERGSLLGIIEAALKETIPDSCYKNYESSWENPRSTLRITIKPFSYLTSKLEKVLEEIPEISEFIFERVDGTILKLK